ncbi:AEC family transporter [Parashewanella spongiae]|uniref:AEC family transporter n=1 Tax=Parashewanella spongiae TaxID=342950 RepID=A0A3A6UNS5_9GAMM|nr:AEC family transporter [Parashewanella spongiae]MCL1076729.1 AEC family transporter [Parashewanella spongiae]RJY19470.1 AEC family transporter [Parashewanella spongiae]
MTIFSIIFPLIFVVILGYFSSRFSIINRDGISGLSRFIFNLCIPAMLFINMAKADLSEVADLNSLLSFYVPIVLLFGVSFFIFNRFSKRSASVLALGASYSNTVLVGLPIISAALGESFISRVFIIIPLHSLILFSLTFILSANKTGKLISAKEFANLVVFNPVVLSISLGIIVSLSGIPLPEFVVESLVLIAKPATAGALFVLGANLFFLKLGENLTTAFYLSAIKLIFLPALVYCSASYIWPNSLEQIAILVLLAASPLGVNAYLIASELKDEPAIIGSTVVISTILSLFSFSFWLYLLL